MRKRQNFHFLHFIVCLTTAPTVTNVLLSTSHSASIQGDAFRPNRITEDPSQWAKRLPPLSLPCPGSQATIEGDGGRLVLEKIRRGVLEAQKQQQQQQEPPPRLLCMVYTHQGARKNIKAIAETWGRRCDGFIAVSNHTDRSIGALEVPHDGPEAYENMWQKIRSMWKLAYEHYFDQYDYFMICGDDVYIVVENLKAYLQSDDLHRVQSEGDVFTRVHGTPITEQRPLVLGTPMFRSSKIGTFPAGGAGYTLNRPALELFARDNFGGELANYTDSREDVFLGSVFSRHNIYTSDTRDHTGALRYGVHGDAQARFDEDGNSPVGPKKLKARYGFVFPIGLDGVSTQTVSMHLTKPKKPRKFGRSIPTPDLIRRYHAILYRDSISASNQTCAEDRKYEDGSAKAEGGPTDTTAPDQRPRGLRLAMLGDSVDRYQYLNLVYYLRWGIWFSDEPDQSRPMFNYLFHEENGGTWSQYLKDSTKVLHPYERCDCFRAGSKGDYQHNITCENRFYYDQRFDNAVAFLWVPGRLPAHGHWDPSSAFTVENSSDQSEFSPFTWEYTSWATLISDYVARLKPRPNFIYLNAHYWPNDFPSIGDEVVQAATGIKTIWSTATVSNNFKAQVKLGGMDRHMCSLTDHCLNNTWMETNLTSRDLYDYFHFKPHVYKTLNRRLLSVLTSS